MTCGAFEDVMKDIEDLKAGGKYDEVMHVVFVLFMAMAS